MGTILIVLLVVVAVKSLTIGSEFNFYYWYKYGKKYTDWYFNNDRRIFKKDA